MYILTMHRMTPFQKVIYRSKQQPLVPLGCLGTCIAVGLAAQGIRNGNSRDAQIYFRWRVGLQAFTIVALLFGSYYYDSNRRKNNRTEDQVNTEKAELRQKLWVEELERRDAEIKDRRRRAELARQYRMDQEKKLSQSDH